MQAALVLDRVPGGIDGRETLGRDRDGFGRKAPRDLAVRMRRRDEAAIMPFQLVIVHLAVGADDQIGIVAAADMPRLDAGEVAVGYAEDSGDGTEIGMLGLMDRSD